MEADLYIDPDDEQTICFRYPSIFKTESILQVIRLEIGALAAWTPSQPRRSAPIPPSVIAQPSNRPTPWY